MVLHTIIGEYDVLYAHERELQGFFSDKPAEIPSTDPAAYLAGTALSPISEAVQAIVTNKTKPYRKERK